VRLRKPHNRGPSMQFTPPTHKPPLPLLPSPHTIVGRKGNRGRNKGPQLTSSPHLYSRDGGEEVPFFCSRSTSGYLSCCRVPFPWDSCEVCEHLFLLLGVVPPGSFKGAGEDSFLFSALRVFVLLFSLLFSFFHSLLFTYSLTHILILFLLNPLTSLTDQPQGTARLTQRSLD